LKHFFGWGGGGMISYFWGTQTIYLRETYPFVEVENFGINGGILIFYFLVIQH